jgi:hypothetical protein
MLSYCHAVLDHLLLLFRHFLCLSAIVMGQAELVQDIT